jgi:DNA-binding NtrC family response regulator
MGHEGKYCLERPGQHGVRVSRPPPFNSAGSASEEVLVVEDEKALREVYQAALSLWFTPVLAASVAEAEALMVDRQFKVVVSDNLMPGESGASFLARMRIARPRMQRILVTGFLRHDEVERVRRDAGLIRLLNKPATMTDLASAVFEALDAYAAASD